jgi:hypothetical protein
MSALESGSHCQFEHQSVVNFVLVDIATNVPNTCEILRFKHKHEVFRNLSGNVVVLCLLLLIGRCMDDHDLSDLGRKRRLLLKK